MNVASSIGGILPEGVLHEVTLRVGQSDAQGPIQHEVSLRDFGASLRDNDLSFAAVAKFSRIGSRGAGIRTPDLLRPRQAR